MWTRKDKDKWLKLLEGNGGNIYDACKHTGIGRRTIYEWIEKHQWFKEAVEDIREIAIDNVETACYKNAIEGNATSQIFLLKTRGKDRGYVERHEITGVEGKPSAFKIEIIDNSQDTDK